MGETNYEFQPNRARRAIIPKIRLAATLRFLAQGSYQASVGQDLTVGVAQQTISDILAKTLEILERKLCPVWIQIEATEEEKKKKKRRFFDKAGIPGVIYCIDGTHVRIKRPSTLEHFYCSRKGFLFIAFSLSRRYCCWFFASSFCRSYDFLA